MFKNKLCADRGSAFIELAIALPLISLVLIGAAELGRIAYFAIEVSDAARAGVAYGAQRLAYAEDTGSLASGINDGIAVAAMDDVDDAKTSSRIAPHKWRLESRIQQGSADRNQLHDRGGETPVTRDDASVIAPA